MLSEDELHYLIDLSVSLHTEIGQAMKLATKSKDSKMLRHLFNTSGLNTSIAAIPLKELVIGESMKDNFSQ